MLPWHHPLWLLTVTALAILFAIGLAAAGPPRLALHSLTVPGPHIPSHLLPTPGVLLPWDPKLPWLTTLLSTLMGPLIILLLLLTFGPCLLDKLLAFIKQRLNMVQLMVLRQEYQGLPTNTL